MNTWPEIVANATYFYSFIHLTASPMREVNSKEQLWNEKASLSLKNESPGKESGEGGSGRQKSRNLKLCFSLQAGEYTLLGPRRGKKINQEKDLSANILCPFTVGWLGKVTSLDSQLSLL